MNKFSLDDVHKEYFRYLNTNDKFSKATATRYGSDISIFISWFKEQREIKFFDDIKADDLQSFLNKPNESTGVIAKAKTRAVMVSAIKNLYNWALNQNIISSDVSRYIKRPHIGDLTKKLILAINKYIPERQANLIHHNKLNEQALFISEKRGQRLTRRGIQLIIDEIAQLAHIKTNVKEKNNPK
jgi:site-specific recombinase XerD